MKSIIGLGLTALTALLVMFPNPTSSVSEEFNLDPKLIADDQSIILEKKTIPMHIAADNKLPWGFC